MMLESVGKMVLDFKVKSGSITQEEADMWVKRAVEETRNGDVYQHSELHVTVGRKDV